MAKGMNYTNKPMTICAILEEPQLQDNGMDNNYLGTVDNLHELDEMDEMEVIWDKDKWEFLIPEECEQEICNGM